MGTFLRLAILLFGLWLGLRIVKRALADRRKSPPSNPPPAADMLRCDYCGTFIPRSEAVGSGGKHYCSTRHRDADHGRH